MSWEVVGLALSRSLHASAVPIPRLRKRHGEIILAAGGNKCLDKKACRVDLFLALGHAVGIVLSTGGNDEFVDGGSGDGTTTGTPDRCSSTVLMGSWIRKSRKRNGCAEAPPKVGIGLAWSAKSLLPRFGVRNSTLYLEAFSNCVAWLGSDLCGISPKVGSTSLRFQEWVAGCPDGGRHRMELGEIGIARLERCTR